MHRDGRVHGLANGDVGMLEEKKDHGPRLRLGKGIGTGPELRPAPAGQIQSGLGSPVLGIVPVEVEAADAVLVVLPSPSLSSPSLYTL